MINWFRKKSQDDTGSSVFPPGYIDMHNHLLPGLDDGAPDAETALHLIGQLVGLGIRDFVCTPHVMEGLWMNSSEKILQTLQDFRPLVEERFGASVTIEAAAEYMIDEGLHHLIQDRDLLPIRGKEVLVEMSFVAPPIHLFSTLADLQVAGYRPMLAHPERYFFYHDDMEAYEQLKVAGCLFQLNLLSLGNYYGKDVRQVAEKLWTDGMYDLVASDLHHQRHFTYLEKLAGTKRFKEAVVMGSEL